MENVTTPFQVWFDEQGKLVIDEENIKSHQHENGHVQRTGNIIGADLNLKVKIS